MVALPLERLLHQFGHLHLHHRELPTHLELKTSLEQRRLCRLSHNQPRNPSKRRLEAKVFSLLFIRSCYNTFTHGRHVLESNIVHTSHHRSNRTVSQAEVNHAGVVAIERVPELAVLSSVPRIVELGDLWTADPSVRSVTTGTLDRISETTSDFPEKERIGRSVGDVTMLGLRVVEEHTLELVVVSHARKTKSAGASEVVGSAEVRWGCFRVTNAQESTIVEGTENNAGCLARSDVIIWIVAWAKEGRNTVLSLVPHGWSVTPENVPRTLSGRNCVGIGIWSNDSLGFPSSVNLVHFQVREKEYQVTDVGTTVKLDTCKATAPRNVVRANISWWESLHSRFEIVRCQSQLLEIVLALHPTSSLPCSLNCRKEQANEDANDRNHDQEFNKREPFSVANHTL